MYIFNKVEVMQTLPSKIDRLEEIAYNIWWVWNKDFLRLFKMIDEEKWENSCKNPVKFLKVVSSDKLEKAAENKDFMELYQDVLKRFDTYMNEKNTYFKKKYPKYSKDVFAYFSAEYGLDETIPIYSGGLGVLSGDHMKTASDLGIPYVGIGLLYKEGYFDQRIDENGNQITKYTKIDLDTLPIKAVQDDKGEDLKVYVTLDGEKVNVKVWQINVGRVKLYLLDTDLVENSERHRKTTYRLYGGDQEMRISQEIVLGFGGFKVLRALKLYPKLYHMNEGHSAFLIFKLIEEIIEKNGVDFKIASEMCKIETIFTTHTAVPAGTDIFPRDLMARYFNGYWDRVKLGREEFLNLGSSDLDGEYPMFNMTKFAITFSGKRNGVSKLHGAVSRELFKEMWPNIMEDEIPINHVTNGVHVGTWMSPDMQRLCSKYLKKDWDLEVEDLEEWKDFKNVPDDELWYTHKELKKKMLRIVKEKNRERLLKNNVSYEVIKEIEDGINQDALIIGFARRFATYKRATMIFSDLERLSDILNDENRPVMLIFSGKAHPADGAGGDLIRRIHEISMMPQFRGKVLLIENYNMAISRFLISGCDVWLNNPRRPMEASGTSGQKAAINGVINFSTSDGWWEEGYNGKNGWVIGNKDIYSSKEVQDRFDSQNLYNILESEIVPIYYEREEGIPKRWINMMKESIISSGGMYSSARMFVDYIEKIYMPALKLKEGDFVSVKNIDDLVKWKEYIRGHWGEIKIFQDDIKDKVKINPGENVTAKCKIDFGTIDKRFADIEIYIASIKENGNFEKIKTVKMKETGKVEDGLVEYIGEFNVEKPGEIGYTFRAVPNHPMILEREDAKVVKWYEK